MTDKPHTELVKLESEDQKTHALLCAITMGKRVMKRRCENATNDHWDEYVEHLEEWETVAADAYFHDRRVADPNVDVIDDDA